MLDFEQYYSPLIKVVRRYVSTKEDAEDVVQDSFLKAYTKYDTFDGSDLFRWLRAIAINTAKDLYQQKKSQAKTIREYSVVLRSNGLTEDQIVADQTEEQIKIALAAMPKRLRETFLLRVEGLSNQEIATKLNVAEGTIRSRIFAARSVLKRALSL